MADAQALLDPYQAPDVLAVAPILQGGNISASATNGQSTTTTVYGVTSDYFSMRDETLSEGAIFSDQEVNIHARVAVIGPDLATTLFGQTTGLTGPDAAHQRPDFYDHRRAAIERRHRPGEFR